MSLKSNNFKHTKKYWKSTGFQQRKFGIIVTLQYNTHLSPKYLKYLYHLIGSDTTIYLLPILYLFPVYFII